MAFDCCNMRKNIIFIILIGLFFIAPPAIKSQPKSAIKQSSGSLAEKVKKASENQLQKDSNLFRVPSSEQMKAWQFITESILKNRLDDAQQMIGKFSFPYQLMLFTDQAAKREYVVLEENYPLATGWGFYVFDLNTANSLVLEIPHPVFDRNTEFQGIDAFLQTGAKAYLLAGAHRRTNTLDTPCTQPKSSKEDVNYPVSDVAHAVATPFQAVHETLVKVIPTTVAVQLHGMGEREICPNAFISNGTATVTTNSKTLLSCLKKNGVEAEIYDGTASCPLSALSNVQGRFSNGETENPCNTPAKTSPEPGLFIHLEQEPLIRRNRESWQPVVTALQCAFPTENKSAKNIQSGGRNSFTFKSTGNPDVEVFFAAPPTLSAKTKVLLVMAGRQRDADNYLDSWIDWGAKNDYLILAPQFDVKNWVEPLGYNFGNIASGKEQENTPNQKSKWAFALIEQMFGTAREKFSIKTKKYDLFGHSAGGQFVHRFLLFYPENHVRLAIAANSGFYTLPELNENFPYGLKKSPVEISRRDLLKWTKRDLVIMRGTADIQRTESLRQTPEADAQGQNRFERAAFMFGKIKSLNPQTKWQLIDVPKIAHDQKGMAQAAQKFLEGLK